MRLVIAGIAQRVFQRQPALAGEIVRVLRMRGGDAFAQFAHRRHRVFVGRAWAALAQESVKGNLGALDHRPDRPQGIVEVQA